MTGTHTTDPRWIRALTAAALSAALATQALAASLAAHPIAAAVRHGDCDTAVDLANQAVGTNDNQATFLAGRMLDEGICVKQDLDAATRYFAHGSVLGDRASVLEYAAKVGLGEGTEQSYERAGQLCHDAGLDPQSHLSLYALGYACTVRGVAGRLLRERVPANAFRPNSGALLVEFNLGNAAMSIRSTPKVEREEESTGSKVRRFVVDAPSAIESAWHDALALVPKPDAARLGNQPVELALDIDMTLESQRKDAIPSKRSLDLRSLSAGEIGPAGIR